MTSIRKQVISVNDALVGQLTQHWQIPEYAQNRLWVDSEASSAKCEGVQGLFELDAPAQILTVRWNSDEGIPLTQVNWQVDNLQWDGSVRLGGIVEAIHLTELSKVDFPMAIVFFSGQPLLPSTKPYPDVSQRDKSGFAIPEYIEGVDDSLVPMTVPLITFADSPLVGIAQESLVQKNPLHVYGRLDDSDANWHDFFALPIVWESVTVFEP